MLDQRRKIYLWQEFPQTLLPSGMDTSLTQLPNDEEFDNVKNLNFVDEVQKTPLVQLVKRIHLENLRDFEIMAEKMAGHEVRVPLYEAGRWTRDEEFGDLLMNGVNPFVLSKCTSLPENFHVTTEMVQGSLSRGTSLEDEIKVSKVKRIRLWYVVPCRQPPYIDSCAIAYIVIPLFRFYGLFNLHCAIMFLPSFLLAFSS